MSNCNNMAIKKNYVSHEELHDRLAIFDKIVRDIITQRINLRQLPTKFIMKDFGFIDISLIDKVQLIDDQLQKLIDHLFQRIVIDGYKVVNETY